MNQLLWIKASRNLSNLVSEILMDRNFGRDEVELIAALDISEYTMLMICLSVTYVS